MEVAYSSEWMYDEAKAAHAVNFFNTFGVILEGKNAGKKAYLPPFAQEKVIEPLFGTFDRETGLRKHRVLWFEVPKKNTKTFIGAGLAMYMLFGDQEPGAEVLIVASSKEQAGEAFGAIKALINHNPVLRERLRVYSNEIIFPGRHGKDGRCRVMPAKEAGAHGPHVHGLIFDEFHTQVHGDLWESLYAGTVAREQPITAVLTTAGKIGTFAYQMHEYARGVQEGWIDDPEWLVFMLGIQDGEDYNDPAVWRRLNPMMGITVQEAFIASQLRQAKRIPSKLPKVLQLHFNKWVGSGEGWVTEAQWRTNSPARYSLDDMRGEPCYVSLDMGHVSDLTAMCINFPANPMTDRDEDVVFWVFWCPAETVVERSIDKGIEERMGAKKIERGVDYGYWVQEGLIIETNGPVQDQDKIKEDILEILEGHKVTRWVYDAQYAIKIVPEIRDAGYELLAYPQTYPAMNVAIKAIEIRLGQGKLNHQDNPVMLWQRGNVITRTNTGGQVMFDKRHSKDKIDGAVALAMTYGALISDQIGDVNRIPDDYVLKFLDLQ